MAGYALEAPGRGEGRRYRDPGSHSTDAPRQDLEEFQRFTAELLASAQAAKKAGQSAEAAAKSMT